jgi:oxygen-independent coproporphyrinogen-3 oxidase
MAEPVVTPELLKRFDRPCPRYTSYPTADRFNGSVGPSEYEAALARAAAQDGPLGVYAHLPFCRRMCHYCGCNVVVSRSEKKMARTLELLIREIDMVAARLPERRSVTEVHLGGGTPNSYAVEDLAKLISHIEERFELASDAEVALEVDPRHLEVPDAFELADVGFNRISMGVQDFDSDVQEAIGRVQSFEKTRDVVLAARRAGFSSVNLDLIYGLPKQTHTTFKDTVDRTLELSPDRIALFSFAYVPQARPNQRRIDASAMPNIDEKLQLFCDARTSLLEAGYIAIGMDHFAKPDDPLATAWLDGSVGRNFQGYTVSRAEDLIAVGVSAIGDVGGTYVQNEKRLDRWEAAIEDERLPTFRGAHRTQEDEMRRFAIQRLMCRFRLEEAELKQAYGKSFADMGPEMAQLAEREEEGLCTLQDGVIEVSEIGKLFVRNVAACFDAYLAAATGPLPYARAV